MSAASLEVRPAAVEPKSVATVKSGEATRIASLDQFRGYTVAGMLLVNFIGGFHAGRRRSWKHHNTYCSYADTIMPQFFFCGRLRVPADADAAAGGDGDAGGILQVVRRNLGLILLGIVVYHLEGGVGRWADWQQMTFWDFVRPLKRRPFETLVHIGVTSLWVLPVIAAGPGCESPLRRHRGCCTPTCPTVWRGRSASSGRITPGPTRIRWPLTAGRWAS